jgi:hypothetical protein
MPVLRTKCISTKVTAEEFARFEALAGEQTISEWVRAVLLKAATPNPAETILLAELLALRAILLNLHFTICNGEPVTADTMRRLIDRADQDKIPTARGRLGFTAAPREP